MSAVNTIAIAYLLVASTGNDVSQFGDTASMELLRDRGLMDSDHKITDLGRRVARMHKELDGVVENAVAIRRDA
jgi:hypothetical protein